MRRPHRVVMAVTDAMPIFEAAVPCQVFGVDRPHLADPWYRFSVVPVGTETVRLSPGFTLAPTEGWDLADTDTLVVPACENVHDDPPAELVELVREAHRRGIRILSICSGAFVLAAAGVLDGRRATTHWLHADELAQRYPAVRVDATVLYVEDANVITSAGTVAGIDACLHVVRIDHGAAVAAELARRLVTQPHRDGGQSQYHRPAAPAIREDWLAALLDWADEHLHLPLTGSDLAARAKVSVRTVERRFAEALGMSPLQWLLQQRVRRAQQFLETSDRPVGWIADNCGFGGAASLRAHFARIVGVPPSAYRRAFHERSDAARVAG
ncbi:helix-turn-helix domain-containing protein [Allokutzneria sp. NRRL B-24872]|uniref:helix-turn-helix domain-containing protein n=1 Tax=Allokutzneria sp. NRRL B-24872 TaxID=1137961 RepID=UPI000A366448|nr:helix-turn-helix domain-containing protein [Allokutzneria sp. NRRL B-24872]